MAPDIEPLNDAVGPDRRTFVKALVVGTVFAAPIVSSFTMSGIESVFGGAAGASMAMSNTTASPVGFAALIAIGNTNADGSIAPPQNFTDPITIPSTIGSVVAGSNTIFPTAPAFRQFRVFRANQAYLEGQLGSGYTYVYGVAITWVGPDANAPGVQLTLTHPSFQDGDEVFIVDDGGALSPYSATVIDGQAVIVFRQDPGFVIARAPAAPPNNGAGAAAAVGSDPDFVG
jgi:hypothetical protein